MQRMALKMAFIYGSMSFKLDINRWDFFFHTFLRDINERGFRLIAAGEDFTSFICDLKCLLIMQLILENCLLINFVLISSCLGIQCDYGVNGDLAWVSHLFGTF